MEGLEQIAKLHQHAAGFLLLQPVACIDLDDHAVDLLGLERRRLRRGRTKRRDGEAFRPPALAARELLREPVGEAAAGRDADPLALEIGDGVRAVVEHGEHDRVGRVGERRDGGLGRALDDHGQLRPRPDGKIERAGGQRLLHARAAAEVGGFNVETMLLENADLESDVDRNELEGAGLRFADADLGLGLRGRGCGHGHRGQHQSGGESGCAHVLSSMFVRRFVTGDERAVIRAAFLQLGH